MMIAVPIRILNQILLVAVLSRIKSLSIQNLGDHFGLSIPPDVPSIKVPLKLSYYFLRNFFLLLIVTKYNGGILRANIILLLIKRGWIMKHEKVANKLLKRHFRGIKSQVRHLYMPRAARAHQIIRRILHCIRISTHKSDGVS